MALVAPVAFVVGAAGGVVLQLLSGKARSVWVFGIEAAVLGVALGIVVPSVVFERDAEFASSLALGGATGLACTGLVLWQFHRRHLLRYPRGSAPVPLSRKTTKTCPHSRQAN
jgi:hypothetical protein